MRLFGKPKFTKKDSSQHETENDPGDNLEQESEEELNEQEHEQEYEEEPEKRLEGKGLGEEEPEEKLKENELVDEEIDEDELGGGDEELGSGEELENEGLEDDEDEDDEEFEDEEIDEEDEEIPPATDGHDTTFFIHRIEQRLRDDCVELTCSAHIRCFRSCRMTGTIVSIVCNETGEETIVELTKYTGVENSSDEFILKTGNKPGTYTWHAHTGHAGAKGSHGMMEATFTYDYYPHALGLSIWGIPTLYVDSGQVTLNVGAECSNFCSLAGGKLTVFDSQGTNLAETELGEELWPNSDALYWAEMIIPVPAEAGVYEYSVQLDGLSEVLEILPGQPDEQLDLTDNQPDEFTVQAEGQPELEEEMLEEGQLDEELLEEEEEPYLKHARYCKGFTISVHLKPEYSVSVTVIDFNTREPIEKAVVRIHPARTVCDPIGLAVVPSKSGTVTLMANALDYYTHSSEITITEDTEFTIELLHKPENW